MSERQALYFSPQPKPTRYRDEEYLAYVRTLPCSNFKCQRPGPNHPHHVDAIDGTGWATKPSDLYAISLCWECHRRVEDGDRTFPMDKDDFLKAICRTLAGAYRALKGR